MGTARKMIAPGSRNIPRKKMKAAETKKTIVAPPGMFIAISAIIELPPRPENTEPKAEAPIIVQPTIAVIESVS